MAQIPLFLKEAKNGDIIATMYGDIILVQRIEFSEKAVGDIKISVYYYFAYSQSEKNLEMNTWLLGFYGPTGTENFYRQATEEEKKLLLSKMEERGYRWSAGSEQPIETRQEFDRIQQIGKVDDGYLHIKKYLSKLFMDYLDENKKEGKMCLSNMECADIDKAFALKDWNKLNRYIQKYIQ